MNVQIIANSVDVTNKVISYDRDTYICTGVGTLNIIFEWTTGLDFDPWDVIVLYEEGTKKGTYNVSEVTKDAHMATVEVVCVDNAKLLLEYYITDVYEIDYVSYARYWLEKFLDEAGVTYSINTEGSGSVMSNNTSIGPEQAYDIVLRLLQMCGWYMYFDANGTCQIGALVIDTDSYDDTFSGTEVLSIETNKNDKMLRNRAVVWGSADPLTEQWVYADRSVITPYNYDSQDLRASVLANSNIESAYSAGILANKMLDEFSKITHEKVVTIAGAHNIILGNYIAVNTTKYSTVGMVTSVGSNLSATGLTTTVILDQRCPRLFGYYGYTGYVYIGTYGSGVWRKLIEGSSWSDFSTGLSNLHVIDLYVRDGIFTCVTGDGNAYFRTINHSTWYLIVKLDIEDEENEENNVSIYNQKIIGCTITPDHNLEFIAIHRDSEIKKSWVLEYSVAGIPLKTALITTEESDEHTAIDIDGNSISNLITTKVTRRSVYLEEGDDGNYGERASHPYDGKMIPSLPPITDEVNKVAEFGRYTYTGTGESRERGNVVFIQNTAEDEGIIYYLYYIPSGSPYISGNYRVTKQVFIHGLYEDEGVYAYWTSSTEHGGFDITIAAELLGYPVYGSISAFHVIDDNNFSFIRYDQTPFVDEGEEFPPDTYTFYKYSIDEEGVGSMSSNIVISEPHQWNATHLINPVIAYGKCALIRQHAFPGNWYLQKLQGYIVDMTTGGVVKQANILDMYNRGSDTPNTTSTNVISQGVLTGHIVNYVYGITIAYSGTTVDEGINECPSNDTQFAADLWVYYIRFDLSNNTIETIYPEDSSWSTPKISNREKDYLNALFLNYGLSPSSIDVVNQNVSDGSAAIRLTMNFEIARSLFRYRVCMPFLWCNCVYSREYTEVDTISFTISLPDQSVIATQSSYATFEPPITSPRSYFSYPEDWASWDVQECHYYYGRLYKLCSHYNDPVVATTIGNYSGYGTGSPVFRNAYTFGIISGVEAPTGLGADLEDRHLYPATWLAEGGTPTTSSVVILGSASLQDEIDHTNYLVIGRCVDTYYPKFSAYLVGYDNVGNVTKRFYYPYTDYEYNPLTWEFDESIKHRELGIGTQIRLYDPFTLNIQGNIIYTSYTTHYTAARTTTRFYKFFDYEPQELINDEYYLLGQDYSSFDDFTVLDDHTYPLRVDISKETPTVVYSRVVGSGVASVLRTSYTNAVDDFERLTNERRIIIHEARAFSVMDEDNFYVYSGALSETAYDYVLAASTNEVRFIDSMLEGEWNTLAAFGMLVSHIETTNYTDNPYFFVSLSGEETHSFYQRNNDGTTFIEQSTNLPSGSGITIIRCDDKI